MVLKIDDKIELSNYRIEKAKRLLEDASILLKNDAYESSTNRSYYSILAASRALLILRGIDRDSHEGIKTMLSKEFIKTGLLPREFGETFRSLQSRRTDSDYGDYVEITKSEAYDSLKRAEDFVRKASELSTSMIKHLKK